MRYLILNCVAFGLCAGLALVMFVDDKPVGGLINSLLAIANLP